MRVRGHLKTITITILASSVVYALTSTLLQGLVCPKPHRSRVTTTLSAKLQFAVLNVNKLTSSKLRTQLALECMFWELTNAAPLGDSILKYGAHERQQVIHYLSGVNYSVPRIQPWKLFRLFFSSSSPNAHDSGYGNRINSRHVPEEIAT